MSRIKTIPAEKPPIFSAIILEDCRRSLDEGSSVLHLLFRSQYKNHHNLLFIILFGRAQRLGIGKINLLYFPDLSGKR